VSIRDSPDGEVRGSLATELDNVHDLCFSPDGRLLSVAGGTPGELGVIEMWDWPSGQLRHRFQTHDDVVYQVSFADDGLTWVAASADEVCSVYRAGGDEPSMRFTKHSRAVLAVVMLPDSETAVSASRDETLRVWDTTTGTSLRTLHNHSRDVNALALQGGSGGLPMLASASADATVRFWQPTIGRMVRFARLPSEPLCIAWVAAGKHLVAGCRDGKARLIDPVAVSILNTIDVSDGWLFAIAVDPTDQRRIAVGSTGGLVRVLTI
jgi:WD40 repeat protein